MIVKGQIKALYSLDRDTHIPSLVDEMIRVKKSELTIFLERMKNRLEEKEAGEYFTIEDTAKLKDGEMEKMMRFFRGAVVPYYIRQSQDLWGEDIPHDLYMRCTDEIKTRVGFLLYDHTGHITEDVNSLATFERVKDFNEFLKNVEAVCFDDEGYIFPNSEHFRKLEKEKGRDAAQRQVAQELREAVRNKHYKREIPT